MLGRLVLLSASCLLSALDEGPLDRSNLRRVLEAADPQFTAISCEYSGGMSFPRPEKPEDLRPEGLYDDFVGLFSARRDGAVLVDVYHRQYPKRKLLRKTTAMIDGKCEQYARPADQPPGRGEISAASYFKINDTGSLGRIFCRPELIEYLGNDAWTMSNDPPETIDGHRCDVVSFQSVKSPDLGLRFWFDLERGGHVLKRELLRNGQVSHRTYNIILQSFYDSNSQKAWFPIAGAYCSLMSMDKNRNPVIGDQPTNLEQYSVLLDSVRLNTVLKDDRFSTNALNDAVVTDKLRRVRLEFGRERPSEERLSQEKVEGMLNQQLAAKAQGAEVEAGSRSRSRSGYFGWSPWIIAASASLLALYSAVEARRSR